MTAPATFQRAMDNIFFKESRKFVMPYLDDIIVYSKNWEDHERHLKIVLGKIKISELSLNKKKCNFFEKRNQSSWLDN